MHKTVIDLPKCATIIKKIFERTSKENKRIKFEKKYYFFLH